jgi:hypothetical protein
LATGFITVSRKKYAVGLFWQPVSMQTRARESAIKINHRTKMHASLFGAFGGMVGLTNRLSGARANMPIAAAEAIESLSEKTFLAIFSVNEGWWLLAVRGGIVIKDRVFDNIDDAKNAYMELNAMPDWALLIAPSDWKAPSAIEKNIADIISGTGKYRLTNISNTPGYIMTVLVLAVFVFGLYNFLGDSLKGMFAPRPAPVNIDPQVAAEYRRKLDLIEGVKPKLPPRIIHVEIPYNQLPDLSTKADQCWKAIAFLSQPITGWVVDKVSCMDGEANAHLLRNHGTIGDLKNEVLKKMPGVIVGESAGDDAILTAKLKRLNMEQKTPQFSSDEIMTAVQSIFQSINGDVDFRRDFVDLDIPQLGDNEILDTDLKDVPVVMISATSKLEPREFIKIMNDVGSIQMSSVNWDNTNRKWSYDIVIYVK